MGGKLFSPPPSRLCEKKKTLSLFCTLGRHPSVEVSGTATPFFVVVIFFSVPCFSWFSDSPFPPFLYRCSFFYYYYSCSFVTVERLCDVMGIDRTRSSRQDELERAIGVCTSLRHGRADSYMKRLHFGYSYLHGP